MACRRSRRRPRAGWSTGTSRRTCWSAAPSRVSRARPSGVTPSNWNSHSMSWRGRPVQAQIRCSTSTRLVVSALPSLNCGSSCVTGVFHVILPGVDELREQQRRQPLGVRRDHVGRVAIDLRRAAELAHAEPAGEHDLAVLHEADRNARHAGRLLTVLDEFGERGNSRRIERVRLLAGESSRACSPSAAACRRSARPARRASRRPPAPCRRSTRSTRRRRTARRQRRRDARSARSDTSSCAASTSRPCPARSVATFSGHLVSAGTPPSRQRAPRRASLARTSTSTAHGSRPSTSR